jgi:hypothetical protein
MGVDEKDINFMYRWRTTGVETAKGRRAGFRLMRGHYGDV